MMNPRKLLTASLSLGLALGVAGAAMAQQEGGTKDSSQQVVDVGGTVANLCVLGTPSSASINVGQLADTSTANVGKITTIANQTVTLPGSFCNFAGTHLTITADALLAQDTSTVQSGFSRAVNFTSTVAPWANQVAAVTTTADLNGGTPEVTGSGGTQNTPKLTDLTLTLSNFSTGGNNTLLLVAGGYTGSVTITLGPAAVAE